MQNLKNVLDNVDPTWPTELELGQSDEVPESAEESFLSNTSEVKLFGGVNFIAGDIDDASTTVAEVLLKHIIMSSNNYYLLVNLFLGPFYSRVHVRFGIPTAAAAVYRKEIQFQVKIQK